MRTIKMKDVARFCALARDVAEARGESRAEIVRQAGEFWGISGLAADDIHFWGLICEDYEAAYPGEDLAVVDAYSAALDFFWAAADLDGA